MSDLITKEIAGISVATLAAEFTTPVYVYNQQTIETRISELKEICDEHVSVRYAVKALPNLYVLSLMKSNGIKLDCVSKGELLRGLRAGFSAENLNYTCDIFDAECLEFVVANNIPINAGSNEMLRQYAAAINKSNASREITVRINPGFGHGHNQKTNTGGPSSKHGIWHEDLPQLLTICRESMLTITGVHMHIGSGCDFMHLSQVSKAMQEIVRYLANKNEAKIKVISAGGGLPIPYKTSDERIDLKRYADLWLKAREELSSMLGYQLELEIEPGRYFVAESGYIVTEIRAIKKAGEFTYYLVDAGFNNLVRPVMYGAYHKISLCPLVSRLLTSPDKKGTDVNSIVVAGPLCESGDVFTQAEGGFLLPRDLPVASVGDLLIIHDTGAYGSSMGSNYNSKPYAAEIMINRGNPKIIRRRQTEEELFTSEL